MSSIHSFGARLCFVQNCFRVFISILVSECRSRWCSQTVAEPSTLSFSPVASLLKKRKFIITSNCSQPAQNFCERVGVYISVGLKTTSSRVWSSQWRQIYLLRYTKLHLHAALRIDFESRDPAWLFIWRDMPGLGITRRLRSRPNTYPNIPLKNTLRPSHKNSVWVSYYFILFATCREFLRKGRSMFFSGMFGYVWGLLWRLRGPYVIPRPGVPRHMYNTYMKPGKLMEMFYHSVLWGKGEKEKLASRLAKPRNAN